MPINVTCACGKAYRFRDEAAGRRVKCSDCQGWVQIPGQPVAPAPDPAPAMPAVPVAKPSPVIPVAEVVPAVPAAETPPEIPVAEVVPAIPVAKPVPPVVAMGAAAASRAPAKPAAARHAPKNRAVHAVLGGTAVIVVVGLSVAAYLFLRPVRPHPVIEKPSGEGAVSASAPAKAPPSLPAAPAKDKVSPAAPVKDKTPPTAPVKDKTPPAAPVKDKTPPTAPVENKTPPTAPAKEPLPPAAPVKEPVPPAEPVPAPPAPEPLPPSPPPEPALPLKPPAPSGGNRTAVPDPSAVAIEMSNGGDLALLAIVDSDEYALRPGESAKVYLKPGFHSITAGSFRGRDPVPDVGVLSGTVSVKTPQKWVFRLKPTQDNRFIVIQPSGGKSPSRFWVLEDQIGK